jgi:putative FmdB family regulatory protein
MPIYEYRCTSCGHELEALQKISEPTLTQCPACHADTLAKQVSAAGFQLKGSGWYATDFRNNGKPKAKPAGDTKPAEAKGADGAADKSVDKGADKSGGESKPESKSESKSEATTASSAGGCGTGCACH